MTRRPLVLDGAWLQRQIAGLARISEAPPPVVTRVLFSRADLRGRAFVKNLLLEEGLAVRQDAVGNIFARWHGSDRSLPPIATGSHIDAIPNAGRYDGVVGVLGALGAVRALKRASFRPRRSIELIVFTAEEPTRFGIGCLGSRLMSGALPAGKAESLRDKEGRSLQQWRKSVGCSSRPLHSVRMKRGAYAGFIELHIEQGPILEEEKINIGIVEKIAAPATLNLELTGVGGHAGAVLMPVRHDALLAGAEIALAVERTARASGSPDTVGTTGVFRIEPGAVNSIPCHAWLEIDLRDTRLKTRNAVLNDVRKAVASICNRRGIRFRLRKLNADAPTACDMHLVSLVEKSADALALRSRKMISRAYHDTLFMARLCPVTMIFIPCRGGVSHRPDEYSSPQQIRDGVRVLADTLATLAS